MADIIDGPWASTDYIGGDERSYPPGSFNYLRIRGVDDSNQPITDWSNIGAQP